MSSAETTTGPEPTLDGSDSGPADDGTLTVGGLCTKVDRAIQDTFEHEVWVKGAISGLSRSANGHVYFDLIDPTDEMGTTTKAVLPVALFASSKHLVNRIMRKAGGIRMHDGIEIRIRGRVAYYPPQGRIQLVMSLIDPTFTLGQMVAARNRLLEKLSADGLMDLNTALTVPALPLRLAVVTSNGSAAMADLLDELERSGHPFRITLLDSRVQGTEAVPSLTEAVRAADRMDVDVVVVVRGGGSRTDLAAFDHERVATAVARCRHPVLIGVGHETDRSVADEVAAVSAKTPTACGQLLAATVDEYADRLDGAAGRLGSLTELHLSAARRQLVGAGRRLSNAAGREVERRGLDLSHAAERLTRSPGRQLILDGHRLTAGAARLSALDPARALERGWTITHTTTGQLVRDTADVTVDVELRTTTAGGVIASRVIGIDGTVGHTDGSPAAPSDDPTPPPQGEDR